MRDKFYQAQLVEIGEKVRAQSKESLLMNIAEEGEEPDERQVPAEPFIHWALGRTALRHLAPEWAAIAPTGMKLPMDDPYHTHWMLGAGFDLREDYGHASRVSGASMKLMFELQQKYGNFKCGVIVGGAGGT